MTRLLCERGSTRLLLPAFRERFRLVMGFPYHRLAREKPRLNHSAPREVRDMAYDTGNLDSAIAAAAGDDPALRAELRASFLESMAHQLDLLGRARCDANWRMAARRLQGLGASFHDMALVALAVEAIDGAPGDPAVQRKLAAHVQSFTA